MRDTILSNIRQSLNSARALPHLHTPIPLHLDPDRETLIAQFAAEWRALGGQFERVRAADAADRACELLQKLEARRVLMWDEAALPPALTGLKTMLERSGVTLVPQMIPRDAATRPRAAAAIEAAEAGLTGAEAAIAQVGAVALRSGPGRGRLASLLVPVHLVFVTPDQFYPTLADWWPRMSAEASNITLIAGPSRTSDIERVLTLGVHGPKQAIAICVD
ncbi:MAG: LUD domain-containing protein [Chloroflexi bacterium]|nr:LUD domain-containing protein [Chloroflexota bacterium]